MVSQKREVLARRDNGEALTAIARSYNVSHSTVVARRWWDLLAAPLLPAKLA